MKIETFVALTLLENNFKIDNLDIKKTKILNIKEK